MIIIINIYYFFILKLFLSTGGLLTNDRRLIFPDFPCVARSSLAESAYRNLRLNPPLASAYVGAPVDKAVVTPCVFFFASSADSSPTRCR
jgi:hypothetical protein